jgi:lipopolysaccharide biosynthesis protein
MKMSRIAIFASYDKNGMVHDYVLNYLRYLKDVVDKIIFIADNPADKQEQDKLTPYVDVMTFAPHGEYDFGSYKRGYVIAQAKGWLDIADELILCNDSCFCIAPLLPIFETMAKKPCDFWGMMRSQEIQDHLQSYFLVFKANVFRSQVFVDHLAHVEHKNTALEVVRCYEVPFTAKLHDAGFNSEAFLQRQRNPTCFPYYTYQKGCPLIKKKVFSELGYCREPLWRVGFILRKNKPFQELVKSLFSRSPFLVLADLYIKRFCRMIYHKEMYQEKVKIKIFHHSVLKFSIKKTDDSNVKKS